MGLLRHHDEPQNGRRFQMREKLASIGDDSWIEDDQGEKVFKVNGKALRKPATPTSSRTAAATRSRRSRRRSSASATR